MDNARNQLVDKLHSANHVLVTVSRNPSVDQLAACIGLTLVLNKLGKHATAVFSGEVPSTIEFLKPNDTLEKTTDSLRDFIIALDKSKADKLRYKVEDDVVRIFITPYKTSITQDDLEFSQGDFNVDVVIAIGVNMQDDLDEAILAHGRILHDATVGTINLSGESTLGSINWTEPQGSSLSELVTELAQTLGTGLLDTQIATALLTGIVAETERFSNQKTTPQTMSFSAALMAAGADQQLVASKLEAPRAEPTVHDESAPQTLDDHHDDLANTDDGEPVNTDDKPDEAPEPPKEPGTLEISHDDSQNEPAEEVEQIEPVSPSDQETTPLESNPVDTDVPLDLAALEAESALAAIPEAPAQVPAPAQNDQFSGGSRLMTEPPTMSGRLTANSEPEALDPSTDPMSAELPDSHEMLSHNAPLTQASQPAWTPPPQDDSQAPAPTTVLPPALEPTETLMQIEADVHSPHLQGTNLDSARDEVNRALSGIAAAPEPIQALNAQPFGDVLHQDQPVDQPPVYDQNVVMPQADAQAQAPQQPFDPTAPPPVPPPIPFNFNPPQQ